MLINRTKNVTVRLGDVRDTYPENSVVWITVGKRFATKRRLYTAFIDRAYIKKLSELTTNDLGHQNPEIKSIEELIELLESIYEKAIDPEDTITVVYFSEITGE